MACRPHEPTQLILRRVDNADNFSTQSVDWVGLMASYSIDMEFDMVRSFVRRDMRILSGGRWLYR